CFYPRLPRKLLCVYSGRRRDTGGSDAASDQHPAGQCVGERRGQGGDRVVRIVQGNGEGRAATRKDGRRAERFAQRGRDHGEDRQGRDGRGGVVAVAGLQGAGG